MTRRRHGTRRSRTERGERKLASLDARCPLSGKHRYDSEDAALEAAIEYSQNHGFAVTSRSAYLCVGCGDWHLTGGTR